MTDPAHIPVNRPVNIPVIDIRRLDADPRALRQIHDACLDWGFFQIVGHDVSKDLLEATHAAMRAFFSLPTHAKRAIERTATNSWGFYDRELTKNTRDWKQIFDVGPDETDGPLAGSVAQWPPTLPAFKDDDRSVLSCVRSARLSHARRHFAMSADAGARISMPRSRRATAVFCGSTITRSATRPPRPKHRSAAPATSASTTTPTRAR